MKRPFLLLYVNDFLGSPVVQAMDDNQFRWYLQLLMRAWQYEIPCHLPSDDESLMMYAGCKNKKLWMAKKGLVMSNFDLTEDGKHVTNSRLIDEYKKLCVISDKRADAARVKAAKALQNSANAEMCKPFVLQNAATLTPTLTRTQTSTEPTPLSAKADDDPISQQMLDQIRKAHPRGAEDKVDSEKAVKKAIQREKAAYGSHRKAAEYLWKRTQVFAQKVATWPEEDKQFVKMCATWFNKGSYGDLDSAWDRKPPKTEPYAIKPSGANYPTLRVEDRFNDE